MTRKEIEYTLRKSHFFNSNLDKKLGYPNLWRFRWNNPKVYELGKVYIHSGGFSIPYSDLTPEKWTQYTGLKFHRKP